MKRGLLVIAGMLSVTAYISADYVIIRVNLGTPEAASKEGRTNVPGYPGMAMPFRPPGGAFPGDAPTPGKSDDSSEKRRRRTGGTSGSPGGYGTPGGFPMMPSGFPGAYGPNTSGRTDTDKKKESTAKPEWFLTVLEADHVKTSDLRHYEIKHKWSRSGTPTVLPDAIFVSDGSRQSEAATMPGAYGEQGRRSGRRQPRAPGQPSGGRGRRQPGGTFPGAPYGAPQDQASKEPPPAPTDENILVKVEVVTNSQVPKLADRIRQQREKLLQDESGRKSLSVDGLLRLADWMLRHWNMPWDENRYGDATMPKEFEKLIDELAKVDGANSKVKNLLATRETLKKPLPTPDSDVARLNSIFGNLRTTVRDHYILLTTSPDDAMLDRRVRRLERLYAGFFYWFALHDQPLTPPPYRLVCVLGENARSFKQMHDIFDALPMTADGFYHRFDHVAVFSATRVDYPFQRLQTVANSLAGQGLDMTKLLRGENLSKDAREQFDDNQITYGRALALAVQSAEEEGEISTMMHEGVQQLAVATGVLARRVQAPQAVRFGLGTFFETPKSAVVPLPPTLADDGRLLLPAMWSGIGQVSWLYQPIFKAVAKAEGKEITLNEKTPDERKLKIEPLSIAAVITDHNWSAAEKADKLEREFLRTKARAEAWALTYFLAREKLSGLRKFYDELGRLPADMDLTEDMTLGAFARAFGIQDKADSNKVDKGKLQQLEQEWRKFMQFQNLEYTYVEQKLKKPEPKEEKTPRY